ncbi:hypothetical protein ACL02U_18000 [Streptomyces sp. MS06]|uniref:hypothetical protein n=1 Tax=Streptomyces sp. MS06 TaxID=3385974 RepID=UPI0039A0DE8C
MTKRLRPALLAAAGLCLAWATACTPAGHSDAGHSDAGAGSSPPAASPTSPSSAAAATGDGASRDPSPHVSATATPAVPSRTPSATPGRPATAATTAPGPDGPKPKASPLPYWPRATFAGLTFQIPPSWTVTRFNERSACLQPVRHSGLPRAFGCTGLAINTGSAIAGYELSAYEPGQRGGWYAATDVQPCPVRPTLADGSFNGMSSANSAPVIHGLRPVGSHKAWYDNWDASCWNGYRFAPQAWYLPVSKVLILDYTGHAETARILASVRFPG